MSPHATRPNLVGSVVSGIYRLERLVGEGGMGSVYEAIKRDGTRVAVKLVHSSRDDARFLREGKIATRFAEDPHLVPVLEVGADAALGPYLVMPLLEGFDVCTLLERARPLPPAVAARIALQACEGLAKVHAKDVVHRDVKPSNLFLAERGDGSLIVRICDFGVARMVGLDITQLTTTGAVMGTPLYMSPESVKDSRTVDARSDVYGMGAVLYEMLCGAAPWAHVADQQGVVMLLVSIAESDPPPLRERAPWIEPALAALVDRTLARDPAARPADARELATLLRAFCRGDTTITRAALVAHEGPQPWAFEHTLPRVSDRPPPGDPAPADPLLGRTVATRYRLVEVVGRGGMGTVYKAERANEPPVAIKIISSEVARGEARSVQRFLAEAGTVLAITSPHVVRTIDVGIDDAIGTPFIVMELLSGQDLGTWTQEHGALAQGTAVTVFRQAAEGIRAAHERGVVHRDIKPANLFLHREQDGRLTVKVCDFGIAKQTPSEPGDPGAHGLTATGGMLGSPRYMSPEQAKDAKRVDHRSDVWSFCIAMYETLSGRRAWEEHTSLGEVIVAICTRPIHPLEELAPWVDSRLAAIVQRGLALEPEARWQSMRELLTALAPFASTGELRDSDFRAVPREDFERARLHRANGLSTASTDRRGAHLRDRSTRRGPIIIAALSAMVVVSAGSLYFAYRYSSLRGEHHVTSAAPGASVSPSSVPSSSVAPPRVGAISPGEAAAVATAPANSLDGSAAELPRAKTTAGTSKPTGRLPTKPSAGSAATATPKVVGMPSAESPEIHKQFE